MAGVLEVLSPKDNIEAIYIAYYGRAPDKNGSDFWLDQYNQALARGQSTAEALTNIANSFAPQPETNSLYPFLAVADPSNPGKFTVAAISDTPTNRTQLVDLISDIYRNEFGRAVSSSELQTGGGVQYWVDEILIRKTDLGKIALSIANGATGNDAIAIKNKISVSDNFLSKTGQAGIGDQQSEVNASFIAAAKDAVGGVTFDPASIASGNAKVNAYLSATTPPGLPIAVDDTASTLAGTPVTIAAATLLSNDTDPNNDPLTITSVQGAMNGTVGLNGTNVVFTPTSGFSGAASFTYTVSDGKGGTDDGAVRVAVAVAPQPQFLLTAGVDTADAAGSQRNGSDNSFAFKFTTQNETVVGSNLTLSAGDVLSDSSVTDMDLIVVAANGAAAVNFQTVSNIERLEIDFTNFLGAAVGLNGVTGGKEIDLDGTIGAGVALGNLQNTGITLVDGTDLTSTVFGINVAFNGGVGAPSRTILGGQGTDNLSGGEGIDLISGGAGVDNLDGFGANDVLRGGAGNDNIITGGGAADRIVFESSAAGNGIDTIATGTPITFTVGANGDILDFSAFIGPNSEVLEVATNSVAGDGVDARLKNIIVFDNDAAIDTRAEIVQLINNTKFNIGLDRDVVVLTQIGGNTDVFYVSTNTVGQVAAEDVAQVATLTAAVSANFLVDNFFG